jgi:hypothetical protein
MLPGLVPHLRADSGCGDAVLTGARLGDDAFLADAQGQKGLCSAHALYTHSTRILHACASYTHHTQYKKKIKGNQRNTTNTKNGEIKKNSRKKIKK